MRVGPGPAHGPFGGFARALACALALVALSPFPSRAQAPATYEVVRGDTLFRIAGKTRPQGATVFQMIVALYRANPDAFVGGNINQLEVGRVLALPPAATVLATEAAQAAAEYRALVAKPPVPVPAPAAPPAVVAPPPAPKPPPEPAARPSAALSPAQAEERHQQGLQAERAGDLRGAMVAYREAAEAGHGPAQKRLGDIYNTGNAVVARDYETALKWYQKARERGVEIPRPLSHTPIPPK